MSNRGRSPTYAASHISTSAATSQMLGNSKLDSALISRVQKKKARFELTEQDKREIKESFELFDTKKRGKLDYYELKVAIRSLGVEIKKAEVLELMNEYGEDNLVDYDSFVQIMTDKFSKRNPDDEMRKAFLIFDEERSGKITLKQLRRVAKQLGEDIGDTELQAMIDEFDKDQDGAINEIEFINIMKQTSLF
ncbi:MAG: putative basal body centrin protein [Streblomastix strix]|uniref:Putative basal body centrin protein n=1 Tax=Streblomastix strix TaxID=222440 RepID=A0A5J4W6Q2_9EUKA|nr:MAG: putative basal body centrin protein [Streblomastix strix]